MTHEQKLKDLDMKYGSVHLITHKNQVYGFGDFKHCNPTDIIHNIEKLYDIMKKENKKQLVKCYDSDIVETNFNFWQFLKNLVICYKEKLFIIKNGKPLFYSIEHTQKIAKTEYKNEINFELEIDN